MKKTYRGGCHCGRVRFEADVDLAAGTGRCNCSLCSRLREWTAIIRPDDFRLMCEETETSDYQFGTFSNHHRFCRTCGVHAYGTGYVEEIGGDYVVVAVTCLDDVTPEELATLPIHFMDGRNDNWFNPPAVSSYL